MKTGVNYTEPTNKQVSFPCLNRETELDFALLIICNNTISGLMAGIASNAIRRRNAAA